LVAQLLHAKPIKIASLKHTREHNSKGREKRAWGRWRVEEHGKMQQARK
jgi:hypothetical protein